ncbi:conserved hypothetical protein [Leishmania major strain Friedlin]|uniref:Ubiquitin-like domain-containing protein n=1 Tax=Leishmania major TaxID=5664 RepID=Q4Q8F6_LEIMA|nr:conserved hypothetical protein [Leishmania major strain Friedlin]CAG9577217.1 Ubiquitin_family_-_putative [Leishmania major strain Friedlin]CAJ05287.1 conserved hypothetical protein [Leishmania major strain Friedlin]|eukprot:XP_001684392.1 conserved hypothetical protein [Leishmania major strain Friedlin]
MAAKREFYVDFEVKFGKMVVSLEMPASATVHDLKHRLEEQTHVRLDKQRLLLNLPVLKAKHRDPPHDTVVRLLFPTELVNRCEQHDGPVAQHVKVSAMLLGSAETAPAVNVAATSEISRLVATTVEHDGRWYRCSYARGYLRQTAYVCRTCIDEGRADPQHALCLACAEFCHGNHEVEEWGVRYYMRCDCCTQKCWRPPADPEAAAEAAAKRRAGLYSSPSVASATASGSEVRAVQMRDIEERTTRKRARSTSPLTPKRSRGSSPVSGIRMATIPPADMPEVILHHSTAAGAAAASLVGAFRPSQDASRALPSSSAFSPGPSPPLAAADQADASTRVSNGRAFVGKRVSDSGDEGGDIHGDHGEGEHSDALPSPLPELSRCAFVVDSKTKKAPVESVLPTNRHNRYPRDPFNWCYCKNAYPSDDPECGGIACMLCCSCYWSTHITRLHTYQYRRMPCYGDVLLGDTVVFKCTTCNTHVCVPCRYRCHKDHNVEEALVTPSKDDGTDNSGPEGVRFSCGCRGRCAIAEEVAAEMIDDESTFDPIPDSVATELMNDDVFTGFVCAYCMQEHPWIATEDPLRCYHGQLPPMAPAKKAVLACGIKSAVPHSADMEDSDVFPYHGMLLPVNAFTDATTCSCKLCRSAFDQFAPRATENATEMIMELHDHCDHCGKSVKDQQAFMCRTCEMNLDNTFFICKDCNAMRELLVQNVNRVRALAGPQNDETPPQADERVEGEMGEVTAEGSEFDAAINSVDDEALPEAGGYDHDLSHEFIEDTFENLYALCGMQILQNMDPEMQEYVASNWDPMVNQVEVANTLSQSLGQIPLQFDEDELREMAVLNQKPNEAQGRK